MLKKLIFDKRVPICTSETVRFKYFGIPSGAATGGWLAFCPSDQCWPAGGSQQIPTSGPPAGQQWQTLSYHQPLLHLNN